MLSAETLAGADCEVKREFTVLTCARVANIRRSCEIAHRERAWEAAQGRRRIRCESKAIMRKTVMRRSGVWSRRRSRSDEQPSEIQSLMRISHAVYCMKKKRQETLY